MLQLEGVECSYGERKVISDVTFRVEGGEFFGVIGPNGSGKTTLLKCISGLLSPTKGRVTIGGRDVQTLGERRTAQLLAVVPQTISIGFPFTALEIVMMGRNPHLGRLQLEGRKDYEIAREAMEMTKTLHLASKRIDQISGGELQRVVIARALAQEPKLLLLDEPTAHLDISHQLEILELIKDLNTKRGMTVVAVFHDLNLTARYSERLLLLEEGRILSMGTPEEVLKAENIRRAYHVDVLVKKHPITSSLYVTPYLLTPTPHAQGRGQVHLVCGGGSGGALIKPLLEGGFTVTAGVLNVLDSDYEIARCFEVPLIEEAPFSEITAEAYQRHLSLAGRAGAVILADCAFGAGNLKNLEVVSHLLEGGIPVIVIEARPFEERDFTGGRARSIYEKIKSRALTVESEKDALDALNRIFKEADQPQAVEG